MSAVMSDVRESAKRSLDDTDRPATLHLNSGDFKMDMTPTTPKSPPREEPASDRDPARMYDFVKIHFEHLFAESDPEVYSLDKIWTLSSKVFTVSKVWCYRITTAVLALPLAAIWGIYFACMAFCLTWCCMPCIKSGEMEINCFRNMWRLLIDTLFTPCFDAMSRCFNNIGVKIHKNNV